jgi:predicted lipid-binding transport protein (Tim44 family)
MLAYIILAIFLLLIVTIIFFEIRNEKKYQESRRQERNKKPKNTEHKNKQHRSTKPKPKPQDNIEKPNTKPKQNEINSTSFENTKIPEITKTQIKPTPSTKEETAPKHILPECNYDTFNHNRLLDMGLSNDEAKEFVQELIDQLEEHSSQIKTAIAHTNIEEIEKLTHTIKGSASNIGTGGVTNLLDEFNTYLKDGTDMNIIEKYSNALMEYTTKLKIQYA